MELPSGIPSHDTFNRFYAMADAAALEKCFEQWISAEAMGCQRDIAEKIVEGKLDYILAVKGNQEVLEDDMQEAFKYGRWSDGKEQRSERYYISSKKSMAQQFN